MHASNFLRWLAVVCFCAAALAGCSGDSAERGKAKNVILVVGDGLGAEQRTATQLATVGARGNLVMDSLPYSGMVGTTSAHLVSPVTDSAAETLDAIGG